jgi:hypothetical protein
MKEMRVGAAGAMAICLALSLMSVSACQRVDEPLAGETAAEASAPPASVPMGGEKSVTRFFVTSRGPGNGGNLGGLPGADAHCQMLAEAEGAGDHTWRAYLSTSAMDGQPAVNARDRIGNGPWYNALGDLIAANIDQLHSEKALINKDMAVTERADSVTGVGDTPNMHDILTGSRSDGTAFPAGDDLTCRNWTSSSEGRAQVGHHDRRGLGEGVNSWNSVHATRGCSQQDFEATGGAGLFYCFAID